MSESNNNTIPQILSQEERGILEMQEDGFTPEDIAIATGKKPSEIRRKLKYLRDDQYLNGYDHFEDDHCLYITYKGHTIGMFMATAPLNDNGVFQRCADEYQSALEMAGLGKQGIVFVRS